VNVLLPQGMMIHGIATTKLVVAFSTLKDLPGDESPRCMVPTHLVSICDSCEITTVNNNCK
jgi:hypothetical protein